MNELEIALFNRALSKNLYEAAVLAHANQSWDAGLSKLLDLATKAYQRADDNVTAAPGYHEWTIRSQAMKGAK